MRRTISRVLNCLIFVAIFTAWGQMVFSAEEGVLSTRGLGSLKYFTVLSNLLQGAASLLYACRPVRHVLPRPLRLLKYAAASAVGLTFLTVMAFLGPLFGYGSMFTGANFWFHLMVPLAAMADFCLLDREGSLTRRDEPLAMAPMLLYAMGYMANLAIQGIGDWPDRHDFYFFLWNSKWWSGALSLVGMVLAAWLIAHSLRRIRARILYKSAC